MHDRSVIPVTGWEAPCRWALLLVEVPHGAIPAATSQLVCEIATPVVHPTASTIAHRPTMTASPTHHTILHSNREKNRDTPVEPPSRTAAVQSTGDELTTLAEHTQSGSHPLHTVANDATLTRNCTTVDRTNRQVMQARVR